MERTATPAQRRKPPVNRNLRSCGHRASALLCSGAMSSIICRSNTKRTSKRRLKTPTLLEDYAEAKRALDKLHRELMDLNPSAARSLDEGLEETLTVHQLRVPINCAGPCAAPT